MSWANICPLAAKCFITLASEPIIVSACRSVLFSWWMVFFFRAFHRTRLPHVAESFTHRVIGANKIEIYKPKQRYWVASELKQDKEKPWVWCPAWATNPMSQWSIWQSIILQIGPLDAPCWTHHLHYKGYTQQLEALVPRDKRLDL